MALTELWPIKKQRRKRQKGKLNKWGSIFHLFFQKRWNNSNASYIIGKFHVIYIHAFYTYQENNVFTCQKPYTSIISFNDPLDLLPHPATVASNSLLKCTVMSSWWWPASIQGGGDRSKIWSPFFQVPVPNHCYKNPLKYRNGMVNPCWCQSGGTLTSVRGCLGGRNH